MKVVVVVVVPLVSDPHVVAFLVTHLLPILVNPDRVPPLVSYRHTEIDLLHVVDEVVQLLLDS